MANDELIYRIKIEADERSLSQAKSEIDSTLKAETVKVPVEFDAKDAVKSVEELQNKNQDSIKTLVELRDKIDGYKNDLKALKDAQKESGTVTDEQKAKIIELETAVKQTSAEYNNQQRSLIAVKAASGATGASYNELLAINKALSSELRNLPLNDTTGRLKELQGQYLENNKALKAFNKELGINTIGDYKDAILEAAQQSSFFGNAIARAQNAQESFQKALQITKQGLFASTEGLAGASKGFQIFNNIIKASVIGIIVTALAGLVAVLTKTQAGLDFTKQAFAAFNAVVGVTTDYLIDIGDVIVKGVINAFDRSIVSLTKLRIGFNELTGDTEEAARLTADLEKAEIELIKSTSRLNEATDKYARSTENLYGNMYEAAKAAKELAKRESDLFRTETDLIVVRAKTRAQVAQLRNDAKDLNVSEGQRKKALEQAIELEKKLLKEEQALAKERLDIITAQNNLSTSTDEDIRKEAEAKANLISLEEQTANRLRELNSELNGFIQRNATETANRLKAINEARVFDYEASLQKEKEAVKRQSDEEFKIIQDDIDKGLALIELRENLEKQRAQSAINDEITRLQSKGELIKAVELEQATASNNLRSELLKQGYDQETAMFIANEQTKLEFQKKFSDAKLAIAQREMQQRMQIENAIVGIVSNTIGLIFGKGKAAAIANGLINTYQGVTKALSSTPPPFNFALAATVGAAGLKQVNAIRSTKLDTAGGVATIGAGVSGGGIGLASQMRAGNASPDNSAQDMNDGTIQALRNSSIAGAKSDKIVINNKVEATIDREGVAIAVREGNDMLNSRGISVISAP